MSIQHLLLGSYIAEYGKLTLAITRFMGTRYNKFMASVEYKACKDPKTHFMYICKQVLLILLILTVIDA